MDTMDPTLLTILGVVAVLLILGLVLFIRSRPKKEEPYFNFPCPGCKRKLRYRAKQAGKPGKCPRCDAELKFPYTPT